MKYFVKNFGMSIYLGGVLGFLGFSILSWEFWVIIVPTIFLSEWKSRCSAEMPYEERRPEP